MALATPLPGVQGARQTLGPDAGSIDTFLIVPGTSDYVTGGYVITSLACRLDRITTAWISGANATAVATWSMEPVFAFVQIGGVSTGAGVSGYTQILLYVTVLATGNQAGSGASLANAIWQLTVQGY